MRRKGLVSVLAAAAFAGTPAFTGTAVFAGTATAGASSPPGGKVHLTAYADSDEANTTVIVTGAVGDFGAGVSVTKTGAIDPEHNGYLKLALSQGSFELNIAGLDKKFTEKVARIFPTNKTTCSGFVSVTGTVPIVTSSGTGSYRGISGSFDLSVSLDEVDPSHPCTKGTQLAFQEIVITGPGTISPK